MLRSPSFYLTILIFITCKAPDEPSWFPSIILLGTLRTDNKMQLCLKSFPSCETKVAWEKCAIINHVLKSSIQGLGIVRVIFLNET